MKRTIEVMLVGAIVLDVAYWSIWFTSRDTLASEHRAAYYEFENAFPLADAWLGLACLLALVCLRTNRPAAEKVPQPSRVTVPSDRFKRVVFHIDTGIR